MKKLLAAALIAVGMVASAAADSLKGINFSLPINTKTWEADTDYGTSTEDVETLGYGLNFHSMSAGKEGFSFSSIFNVGLGKATLSSDDFADDLDGYFVDLKWGWGIFPVNNERIILGFHAFVGIDMLYFEKSIGDWTTSAFDFDVLFGADAVFGFKFGGGMSLMAGLDVGTNVAGACIMWITGPGIEDTDGNDFSYGVNGFVVKPRIGFSWGL